MVDLEPVANNLKTSEDKASSTLTENGSVSAVLLSCPSCSKPYQMNSPQEGLVYQCQKCQNHFMVSKDDGGKFKASLWSEDQILKTLFDIAGETAQSKLSKSWRKVFENLEDMQAHEQFIALCQQKNSLNVAKEKYKQLSVYLNWDALPDHLKNILEPSRVKLSPWSERMPWILLSVAVLLILLGSIMPGHRNMIGAGVLVGTLDFLIYRKRFVS